MPWFKLFDEVEKRWDGVLRYNMNEQGQIWFPDWVVDRGPFSTDMVWRAYEMGPYYQYQG